jgi:hypothetical protein
MKVSPFTLFLLSSILIIALIMPSFRFEQRNWLLQSNRPGRCSWWGW